MVAALLGVEVRNELGELLSDPLPEPERENEDMATTKKNTKKPAAKKAASKKPAAKKATTKKPASKPATKKPAAKKPATKAASKKAETKPAAKKKEETKKKETKTHQAENGKKVCRVCEQKLPVDAFTKYGRSPDGLSATCRNCKSEARKAKRAANG